MTKKLTAGDRVAYSAAFIKQIQAGYETAQRRGTFVKYVSKWGKNVPPYAVVKWDDQDKAIAEQSGQFADADYVYYALEQGGTLVNARVLAKHGSSAFTG